MKPIRSRPKLKTPLKKSTLTLSKVSRRGPRSDYRDNNYRSNEDEKSDDAIPRFAERERRRQQQQLQTRNNRESTPVQTDRADVPANLEERNLHPKEIEFRKNAIKILNWLFENPQITIPHDGLYGGDAESGEETADAVAADIETSALSLTHFSELERMNVPEWRLTISPSGHQFIVKGNSDGGDSFYRALAQAITGDESNCLKVRQSICKYVTENSTSMARYLDQLREYYRKKGETSDALYAGAKYIAKLYRTELLKEKKPGSYFELRVASDLYQVNLILIFRRRATVTYANFVNKQYPNAKTLAFLVWPTKRDSKSPLWSWLIPVGDFSVPNGNYPFTIKRTFVVQNCCYGNGAKSIFDAGSNPSSSNEHEFLRANVLPKAFTFQVASQEFHLPPRNFRLPIDLYSMLSVIFFENGYHSEEIRDEIWEHRKRLSYFIAANKRKKKGYGRTLFAEPEVTFRQARGDFMDLKIAASIYKFCYTLITMDRLGNLSHMSECRDKSHSHVPKEENGNFIGFFTRVGPRSLCWYKLDLYCGNVPSDESTVVYDEKSEARLRLDGQFALTLAKEEDGTGESVMSMADQARLAFEAMYSAVCEQTETERN